MPGIMGCVEFVGRGVWRMGEHLRFRREGYLPPWLTYHVAAADEGQMVFL